MINLNKQLIIYYYVLLFFQEFLYGDGIWGLALDFGYKIYQLYK